MFIKRVQSTKEVTGKNGTVFDYPVPNERYGFSAQELDGRFPESGVYRNTVCFEMMYIIEGTGKVVVNGEEHQVEAGDLIVLEPGDKHFGEYKNVKLVTFTSPNWSEEQCEII